MSPASITSVNNMNYEETELTLGLPGRGTKRSISDQDQATMREIKKAKVVGWPPVKEHRKSVKMSRRYVKVAVDGAPYLRKVDLQSYDSYDQLLSALQELFGCFTQSNEKKKLVDYVNAALEYVPTYEDKDGDWMLLGDVPWKMFAHSCKRLRLMTRTPSVC